MSGLCAKGGFEVNIVWQGGSLAEVVVTSKSGSRCNLRYGGATLAFNTKKGAVYRVIYKDGKLVKA